MAVNVTSMTTLTSESRPDCAWCLMEQGLISAEHPPKEGESHGICDPHYAQMLGIRTPQDLLRRMRSAVNRMPLLVNQNAIMLRSYSLRR